MHETSASIGAHYRQLTTVAPIYVISLVLINIVSTISEEDEFSRY